MPDLSKHNDLLNGKLNVTVSWRVEEGGGGRLGRLARQVTKTGEIDLDALAMAADASNQWVGAAHKFDKAPFDGALRYLGDSKASEGGAASETVEADLDSLAMEDVSAVVFGITCFNNATALGKLAELRLAVTDEAGNRLFGGRRSIEGNATAALVCKAIHVPSQNGWQFTQIIDTYNVNVNGNARQWRQLAQPATEVLRRR